MDALTAPELFAFDGAVAAAWGAREDGSWDPIRDARSEAAREAASHALTSRVQRETIESTLPQAAVKVSR